MRRSQGFTVTEMMIALAISVSVIAVALALVVYGFSKARDSDVISDSNNYARLAGEFIAANVRNAGMGSGAGVYLNNAGAPLLVNPIYGADNLTTNAGGNNVNGSDDLWIIVPDKNVTMDNCNKRGAYVSVIANGTGPLSITPWPAAPCVHSLANGDNLLVTNLTNSALLTNIQLDTPGPNQINYAESVISGFSDAPSHGGFQIGDLAFRAQLIHYYLDLDPLTNRLALYSANGRIGADFLGRPMIDMNGTAQIVQRYIEDFQVVYWLDPNLTNDPTKYVDQHGLASAFQAGLRAVEIYVVSTTRQNLLDANAKVMMNNATAPRSIANHVVAANPDGFRRSIYSRRVEIPNLMTSNL
jgi:Tfp pilus assembly major pilin PilA